MQIQQTEIAGVMTIQADVFADERGLFARTFDAETFTNAGLPSLWPQCNISWNAKRGTLRGLHYQGAPLPDPKLVRCTRGRIFDVAVDLRRDSATFCKWFSVELSHEKRNALYIPPGCAHGFVSLEDDCEVLYMMGTNYVADLARGVRWNDPAFAIDWPLVPAVMSERDASYPDLSSCVC